jgi:hypothetical protein
VRVNDKPLPGDLVVRCRDDRSGPLMRAVWVITIWPEPEAAIAGPYQSIGYAVRQARAMLKDQSEQIWLDHARANEPEQLEDVTSESS